MAKFEVEFYGKENGEQPVKDFLLSLDVKMRAKMASTITILQENGHELREPRVSLNFVPRSVQILPACYISFSSTGISS